MLARLHQAGFHIWPFQAPALPLALEIYPRLFTGPVVKSSRQARAAYLQQQKFARLSKNVLATAASSEDAFDAICSVMGMVEHAAHLTTLTVGSDERTRLEGAIWQPTVRWQVSNDGLGLSIRTGSEAKHGIPIEANQKKSVRKQTD